MIIGLLGLADAYYHGNTVNTKYLVSILRFRRNLYMPFFTSSKQQIICRKSNVNDQQCVTSMGIIFWLHLIFSHINSVMKTSHLKNIWDFNIIKMKLIAILGILVLGISMSSSRPQKKNNKMPMPVSQFKLQLYIYIYIYI